MNHLQYKMTAPIGPLFLIATDEGLRSVLWNLKKTTPMWDGTSTNTKAAQYLKQTRTELEEYFAGLRTEFELPLDVEGTDFQKKVWDQLKRIPYAETWSYKDIAVRLKDPNASRAVGTANGRNPLSIIVPCHRVIASDGTLGGYAGGLEIKTKLLDLEKKTVSTRR